MSGIRIFFSTCQSVFLERIATSIHQPVFDSHTSSTKGKKVIKRRKYCPKRRKHSTKVDKFAASKPRSCAWLICWTIRLLHISEWRTKEGGWGAIPHYAPKNMLVLQVFALSFHLKSPQANHPPKFQAKNPNSEQW